MTQPPEGPTTSLSISAVSIRLRGSIVYRVVGDVLRGLLGVQNFHFRFSGCDSR